MDIEIEPDLAHDGARLSTDKSTARWKRLCPELARREYAAVGSPPPMSPHAWHGMAEVLPQPGKRDSLSGC
jgi:hypothetical protein